MSQQVKSAKSSSSATDAETIINIDAAINNQANPAVGNFKAGTYEVTVIGKAEGGKFDAWSLWDFTTGCDDKGENCYTGWVNEYNISANEFTINMPTTGKYETAEQALAKARGTSFTLAADSKVNFFIRDDIMADNRGGMSLKIRKSSPYPQLGAPSILVLLLVLITVIALWLVISVITPNPPIGG